MTKKPNLRVLRAPAREIPTPDAGSSFEDYDGREKLIAQYGREEVERNEASFRESLKKLAEERQPGYQQLFPGTPERARRLGRIYQKLHDTILGNMYTLEEPERAEMRAALEDVIPLLTGRPPRLHVKLDKAPTLWAERDPEQKVSPAAFTRDTYKRWIGQGLTRQHLRELDPQLYHALSVWEHRHPEDRIKELPTLAEVIDDKIAALANEFTPDELRRLGTTLQTRLRRTKN